MWSALALLPELRTLTVKLILSPGDEREWQESQDRILQPARKAKAADAFLLHVPWSPPPTAVAPPYRSLEHDTFFEPRAGQHILPKSTMS